MDEMRNVRNFRREVPDSSQRSLLPARDRLLDEARTPRGPLGRLVALARPRRPRVGVAEVATAGTLSVVLAGGLIFAQTVDFGSDVDARRGGPGGVGGVDTSSPAMTPAAVVLYKAADVARSEPAPSPDGGFTYVETKRTGHAEHEVGGKVDPYHTVFHTEVWRSVDGSAEGLQRDKITSTDVDIPFEGGVPAKYRMGWQERPVPAGRPLPDEPPSLSNPSYAYLNALPRDPDKILALLHQECENAEPQPAEVGSPQCGYLSWKYATSSLIRNVAPPDVRAAIFQAIAKIPGVTVIENATLPATGESGIGITRKVVQGKWRADLVFDPKTYELLGSRTVAVKDDHGVKAGTVIGSLVVLERGFVDKVGQRP